MMATGLVSETALRAGRKGFYELHKQARGNEYANAQQAEAIKRHEDAEKVSPHSCSVVSVVQVKPTPCDPAEPF